MSDGGTNQTNAENVVDRERLVGFDRPIALALYPLALLLVARHDHRLHVALPDHAPHVADRVLQRALARDVRRLAGRSLWRKTQTKTKACEKFSFTV